MHLVPPASQGQRHDGRTQRDLLTALGPVGGDLATELVAEDDPLIGPHEPVVSRLREKLRLLVGVVTGVQVGSADPAAPDVDQDLPLRRFGRGQVDDLELRLFAGDRLHARKPLKPRSGCRRTAAAT